MINNLRGIFVIDKDKLRNCFLYTYIIGFIAHGYAYANFQPSHDSLNELISDATYISWKLQLGRYLKPLYDFVFGCFESFPWSNGIFSLFWISISAYLICEMLNFEKKHYILIVCGILTTNITVISLTATYAQDLGGDMFALALSVLATYIWQRYTLIKEKNYKLFAIYGCLACLCLMFSLALYQAYICVYVSLVLMISIIKCINAEKNNLKDIWNSCFCALFFLITGGVATI